MHHHLSCWYICWISARLFFLVSGTHLKDKKGSSQISAHCNQLAKRPVGVFSDCQRSWSKWVNFYLFWLSDSSKRFLWRMVEGACKTIGWRWNRVAGVGWLSASFCIARICSFPLRDNRQFVVVKGLAHTLTTSKANRLSLKALPKQDDFRSKLYKSLLKST